MLSNNNTSSGGTSFAGVLAIVFIVLKLCHVISWSWWWVLSPIWIGVALLIAVFGGVMIGQWLAERIKMKKSKKNDENIVSKLLRL